MLLIFIVHFQQVFSGKNLGFRIFHDTVTGDDFVADAQISFEQLLSLNAKYDKFNEILVS